MTLIYMGRKWKKYDRTMVVPSAKYRVRRHKTSRRTLTTKTA